MARSLVSIVFRDRRNSTVNPETFPMGIIRVDRFLLKPLARLRLLCSTQRHV